MKFLEDQGFNITFLTPDKNGTINPAVLKSAITKDTILISIMHANNETGIIQPIEEMSSGISGKNINFHTDAIQTVGKIPVNVEKLGVNLLSMSAHKVHGPKGVGALYIKNGTQIKNILFGGGQENGLRPGTYNVPGIAGYGMAARIARTNLDINEGYVDALREKLEYGIKQLSQNAVIPGERGCRLYNTLMVCFPGEDGNSLISSLDLLHIQVSSGAACTSESSELSHVLLSMKIDPELAKGAVRFSLGPSNSEDEVDTVLKALKKLLKCKY
jgi:cysteine desulfurase